MYIIIIITIMLFNVSIKAIWCKIYVTIDYRNICGRYGNSPCFWHQTASSI